jgi:hypothetical protein
MKNIEHLLQDLLSEHEFLKNMQSRIVENYDILTQNQKQNADNHEVVVKNQTVIVRNQEIIVNNQISIIRNQRQIVQNQVTLDVMLKTQALLLNLVNKMAGQNETIEQTEEVIHKFRAVSQENLRFNAFNDSESLS